MPRPTRPRQPAQPATLLQRLRLQANLTQNQAAVLLGTTQPALSRAEAGPCLVTQAATAYGLRLSVEPDPLHVILAAHPDPMPRDHRARAAVRDAIRAAYPGAAVVYTPEIGEPRAAYLSRVRPALEVRA
jgi:transcriptional regulator with XRE-family HTH domain